MRFAGKWVSDSSSVGMAPGTPPYVGARISVGPTASFSRWRFLWRRPLFAAMSLAYTLRLRFLPTFGGDPSDGCDGPDGEEHPPSDSVAQSEELPASKAIGGSSSASDSGSRPEPDAAGVEGILCTSMLWVEDRDESGDEQGLGEDRGVRGDGGGGEFGGESISASSSSAAWRIAAANERPVRRVSEGPKRLNSRPERNCENSKSAPCAY